MYYRTLLAAAMLTLSGSLGAQTRTARPTPIVIAHPIARPPIAERPIATKTPTSTSGSTSTFLPNGPYILDMQFTHFNGSAGPARDAKEDVYIVHSGSTLTITATGTQLTGTVTGTQMSASTQQGSTHAVFSGSQSTSGASGSVTATKPGYASTGTFTLTHDIQYAQARMPKEGGWACNNWCKAFWVLVAVAAF